MCNKYLLTVGFKDERLLSLVEICNKAAENDWKISIGNLEEIMPNFCAPALMVVNSQTRAVSMRWGFESERNGLVINARSETANDRAMFKKLVAHQRCAMPATGYFEWRDGDNLRHLVTQKDDQTFYLAGLYRSDARGRLRFVVLTRAAYGLHAKIHNRMPCLLYSRAEARQWISGAMPIENLCATEPDALKIEVQGLDQLKMEFDD